MRNNSGFSLIELIVVVAIIALMSTGTMAGLGYLSLANTSKCATKIDSGFTKLKSKNMAKADTTYMHLYNYNDNFYIVYNDLDETSFTPNGTGEQIANSKVQVSMDDDPLENGESICFSIRKKDGSFVNTLNPTSKIVVSGQTSKTITIVTSTGKHFIE